MRGDHDGSAPVANASKAADAARPFVQTRYSSVPGGFCAHDGWPNGTAPRARGPSSLPRLRAARRRRDSYGAGGLRLPAAARAPGGLCAWHGHRERRGAAGSPVSRRGKVHAIAMARCRWPCTAWSCTRSMISRCVEW